MKKGKGTVRQVAVCFSPECLGAIERVREELERKAPGIMVSRADAIRYLIALGLEAVKAEKT
jgi:hypothetical protein